MWYNGLKEGEFMATEVKTKEKEFWETHKEPLTKEDKAELQRIRRNVRVQKWDKENYEKICLRLKPGVNDRLKAVSSETGMSIPQMVTAIASGEAVFIDPEQVEKLTEKAHAQGLSTSELVNTIIKNL